MSSILCNVATGIIEIIFPETSPTFTGQYLAAMKSVGAKSALLKSDEFYPKQKWIKLLKVCYFNTFATYRNYSDQSPLALEGVGS